MRTEILNVNTQRLMQAFLKVPAVVYGEKHIPPSVTRTNSNFTQSNPTLEHIHFANFVAIQDGQPVGRISATVDSLNPKPDEGFWGSFECIDDTEAAGQLLQAAAAWLKKQAKTIMIGPATLNTNQQVGLLVEGFECALNGILPYNPIYYQKLAEEAGLTKVHDLECFKWELPQELPPALLKASRLENVVIRPVNYRHVRQEAALVQEIYNKTFTEMWGFIPLTFNDAQGLILDCARQVPPELFFIIEIDQKPAAMILSIPYQQPSRENTGGKIRLAIGGIVPEFRHQGLHRIVLKELFTLLKKLGYTEGEASQVAESNYNVKNKIIKPLFGEIIKLYRVYQQKLD